MKKFIKNKKIKVFKTLDENNLGSIARVFLSSFIIIFIFYSLPLMINFANDNILKSKEFRNNSKKVLAYTLDKKNNVILDGNEQYNESDLLVYIYSLNEKETDTVRLDASTIKQLYEDTNYKLEDIFPDPYVRKDVKHYAKSLLGKQRQWSLHCGGVIVLLYLIILHYNIT